MTLILEKRLISVLEYHKMGEVGIFKDDDKVELLNGEIIQISPINTKHSSHVKRITALFYSILNNNATIGIQDPVTIPELPESEPNITISKFDANFYADKNPHPEDILILIEVSDSTLQKDKLVKLPIYASAKIKEYWIVNLVDSCIEVYKKPNRNDYEFRQTFYINDEIELTDFDLKIKVSNILVQ